jgi:acetyl esterase/lipase
MAAWVAQKAAKDGPPLRLQVLLHPNLDATTSKPSWKELGTGAYLVSHAEMIERYDAYLPQARQSLRAIDDRRSLVIYQTSACRPHSEHVRLLMPNFVGRK